jgi:DNA-binding transcriptional LysR family regulator
MTGSERWAALEVRLLAAFAAVAETGSFAEAARRLGYTQSGVSQQIAALERIVDRRLLVRHAGGRRPVETTEAGAAFLAHSKELLAKIDAAYRDLAERDETAAQVVRLAAFPSAAVHLVPQLLASTPLPVELQEAWTPEQLVASLDRGAELVIAALPLPPHFVAEEIGDDPYVALVASGSRLAARTGVSVSELAGLPLIGIRSCPHEELVESQLRTFGLDVSRFRRYDDNQLIQALAANGAGVAIVPSLVAAGADAGVTVLRLHANLPPRKLVLAQHRDRLLSPAARELKQRALPLLRAVVAGDLEHAAAG